MNSIKRNLRAIFRRSKLAVGLNMLGLSVAFAAFMIMMIQVSYEQTFDRCHPNSNRIFRVDLKDSDPSAILARGMVDAIEASSGYIEEKTIINPWIGNIYVTVGDSVERQGYRERFITCYPNITRMFGFNFTEGDAGCLADPEKVIIPLSMARRMFGNEPAAGKRIEAMESVWTKTGMRKFVVGAVYRDFPGNTQLDNCIYSAIDNTMEGDWTMRNFICYIMTASAGEGRRLEAFINQTFNFGPASPPDGAPMAFNLVPLHDVYYGPPISNAIRTGSRLTVRIIMAIAMLLIAIAAINFTNFSIAMAPMRMKSLNTQLILGGGKASLRRALTSEAVLIAAVAWLVSILIVYLLGEYRMLPFIEASTGLRHIWGTVIATGAVAVGTGFAAGLYPAWYATSFQPALALKGNFALSPAGRSLRSWLIGFQYVISIGLIIAAMFIQLQNNYVKGLRQGFDKERVAVVKINGGMYQNHRQTIESLIGEDASVEGVAFTQHKLGGSDVYSYYSYECRGRTVMAQTLGVSHNVLSVLGIPIAEGRSFRPTEEHREGGVVFVINRLMQERLGVEVGDQLTMGWPNSPGEVAGIIDNVKFSSARYDLAPLAFAINSPIPAAYLYARISSGADMQKAAAHIRASIARIDPSYPADVEFFDSIHHDLYQKEENLNASVTMLAVLAVILSITGVFGLVMFETQYRRKEIGVRKVYGATTAGIIGMFNKTYLRIVCLCFIPSALIARYAVGRWLEGFADKTPMHWWVFAVAFIMIAIVTAATVSIRNRQAAGMNPVESLRG
ncbi:MAG: ABC transporter permease [Tannerellaceae bacterium]|jgi:putative ABC transport system permease protein|nr:ABC transporter permease [Tannerellaceae bacterium]